MTSATNNVRDRLLATCKRRYSTATIDGIGEVRLQSLSELERAKVEVASKNDQFKLRALLIAVSLVDVDGNRLFSDDDVDSVLSMDSRITLRLSDAVLEHIGRDDEAGSQLKNYETTPGEPVP